MKVLFYYPSNKQSNSIETLLEELSKKGVEVIVLTTCEKGELHAALEKAGITTYTNPVKSPFSFLYYFKQVRFLIKFCRKNEMELIMSHLQHANFIAVLSQFFVKCKLLVFRHHFQFSVYSKDKTVKRNKMESFFDYIINRFAKRIIVPSNGVLNGMLEYENVRAEKLSVLPYIYNFDNYVKPDKKEVEIIRLKYKAKLTVLMCSRLIGLKRHYLVFPIIKKLVEEGYDIKLLVLDDGPEKQNLEMYIRDNRLENSIFLLGFRSDFINYMDSSDLIIHPSLTEASNSAIKEMGYLGKAVAVCSKVGDFDDYIINGQNGFLMPINDTEVEIERIMRFAYNKKNELNLYGENLKATVLKRFNKSEEVLNEYLNLFNEVVE